MAKLDNVVKNGLKMLEMQTEKEVRAAIKNATQNSKSNVGKVKTLPTNFYCDWLDEITLVNGIEIRKKDVKKLYPNCCFNHRVGLPTIKFEDETASEPGPLFGYQKRILEKYHSSNYYAQNKCRGAGTSELITVRYNAFKYMNTTVFGRKCLIVAGVNEDQSKAFMYRIKQLCDKIPECYMFEPKTDSPTEIYFKQGGSIWALPANANAVRSFENVGDIIYEEAAFWKNVDDMPVLKAGEPQVITSKAHVNIFSTPNGMMRFFWEKIFDPEAIQPTKYLKHTLNWREVIGIPEPNPEAVSDLNLEDREPIRKLYIHKFENDRKYKEWFLNFFPGTSINEILDVKNPIIDIKEIINLYKTDKATYDQEFDNQFTLSENRAFGDFMTATDRQCEEMFPV